MSEDDSSGGRGSPSAVPAGNDGAVEAYETDHGVVLYDANNPLAWIESHAPVLLGDVA